jgi:effector-binding domain-containing protein
MKKLGLLAVFLVLIMLVLIYTLIPPYVKIHRQVRVYTPEQAVVKYVMHSNSWNGSWWPAANRNFVVQRNTIDEVTGRLLTGNRNILCVVRYTIHDSKSVYLNWNAVYRTGANPINRVLRYLKKTNSERYIDNLLAHAKRFLEDDRQVYGIHVQKAKIEDSVVLVTKRVSKGALTLTEIYKIVHSLQAQAFKNKAHQVGYPMINTTQLNSGTYVNSVAIPVKKSFPPGKGFNIKRLVYHANLLTVKVKGGNSCIKNALDRLTLYIEENGYTPPAIPYEELITDRAKVPDTSKWITQICYPVL